MARNGGGGIPCGASYISPRKQCRIGLSVQLNKRALANAPDEKLKEWYQRAPYQYQRNKIGEEIQRRVQARTTEKVLSKAKDIVAKPSRQLNARALREADLKKLEEWKQKAPYQYQRDKIDAEIARRNAEAPKAQPRDRSVPPELKRSAPKISAPKTKWQDYQDDELEEAAKLFSDKDALRELERRKAGQGASNPGMVTGMARRKAANMDKQIEADISHSVGDRNYNWGDSHGSGSKQLGQGGYGTVMREGSGKNAVKRGDLGKEEAALIDLISKSDLGPRLYAADLDGPGVQHGTRLGRLAMSVLPGEPISHRRPDTRVGGVQLADAYWKARADLHRLGVAHNDMHIENVFVDKNGKGRFVDMGLGERNAKAALAEALGALQPPRPPVGAVKTKVAGAQGDGDWQTVRWSGNGGQILRHADRMGRNSQDWKDAVQRFPVMGRVLQNKERAILKMRSFGLDDGEINSVMTHGIRSTPESFERGAMGRLTHTQAMQILNILYEGI